MFSKKQEVKDHSYWVLNLRSCRGCYLGIEGGDHLAYMLSKARQFADQEEAQEFIDQNGLYSFTPIQIKEDA